MAHSIRAARADPRVHLPMRRRRSQTAPRLSPRLQGGQGTAQPRPSEPEAEVIFVVLSVRSRSGMSSRVSPATWQAIFFIGDGTALPLCLPALFVVEEKKPELLAAWPAWAGRLHGQHIAHSVCPEQANVAA